MSKLLEFQDRFKSVSERSKGEREERLATYANPLSFGLRFLDIALFGIFRDDLVLLGAPSGIGKTQFCVNLALANITQKKKVHFIALEASEREIERRMKYAFVSEFYWGDLARPNLGYPLTYTLWMSGRADHLLKPYDDLASMRMQDFDDLYTFYKAEDFTSESLDFAVMSIEDQTDLIILDHVHFMDIVDENENRGLKLIAKKARNLTQITMKPIILVCHLRKRDKRFSDLVPSIDDFHGSSDLAKIATKAITLAPGEAVAGQPGKYETYIRVVKNRMDGDVTRYVAKSVFNSSTRSYEKGFELGKLIKGGTEWEPLQPTDIPKAIRHESEKDRANVRSRDGALDSSRYGGAGFADE